MTSTESETLLEIIRDLLSETVKFDFIRALNQAVELTAKMQGDTTITPSDLPQLKQKLYQCWPGIGKTETITQLAEEFSRIYPTFVLGLSHKSFENVEREGWAHWKGHDSDCGANVLSLKGYKSQRYECSCEGRRVDAASIPTFAPIEYVLSDEPLGEPLTRNVYRYPLWIIDEIDFAKFVGKMAVTRSDVDTAANRHPSETIKQLSRALLKVMDSHTKLNQDTKQLKDVRHWYGTDLYRRLDIALQEEGSSLNQMRKELGNLGDLPTDTDWTGALRPSDLPINFAPRLAARLQQEAGCFLTKFPYHPLIHLVWDRPEEGQPVQSMLRVSWKKWIANYVLPVLVMDASAEPELLKQVFGTFDVYEAPEVPFPTSVHVYQLVEERVTKSTLGVASAWDKGRLPDKYRQMLQQEMLERGVQRSDGTPRKVGIITFKNLVDDCVRALVEVGYEADNIVTGYYYNLRGDNDFQDCDIVVALGFPVPNPQGLFEEACALFEEDMPLSRDTALFDDVIKLRNGNEVKVKGIMGYANDGLNRLYLQKSRWELYQAFHRARPYLKGDSDSVTEVLVFTNVPIPDIEVDGFLGTDGPLFACLEKLLKENSEVTITELEDALLAFEEDSSQRARTRVKARIKRAAVSKGGEEKGWLCQATGTTFIPGTSKTKPGKFIVDNAI